MRLPVANAACALFMWSSLPPVNRLIWTHSHPGFSRSSLRICHWPWLRHSPICAGSAIYAADAFTFRALGGHASSNQAIRCLGRYRHRWRRPPLSTGRVIPLASGFTSRIAKQVIRCLDSGATTRLDGGIHTMTSLESSLWQGRHSPLSHCEPLTGSPQQQPEDSVDSQYVHT